MELSRCVVWLCVCLHLALVEAGGDFEAVGAGRSKECVEKRRVSLLAELEDLRTREQSVLESLQNLEHSNVTYMTSTQSGKPFLEKSGNGGGGDVFLNEVIESGYIDVGLPGGEMFYVMVPYKNNSQYQINSTADNDVPFTLWLTGGPGCSSEIALLKENGPLNIDEKGNVTKNPYSWSMGMHMVYVDQPLGTGFSVAGDYLNYATNEEHVSQLLREFLTKFIIRYPQMQNRPLYIAGESFAGHFIPALSESLLRNPVKGINLNGIALGNAWVNPKVQYQSFPDFALLNGLIEKKDYQSLVAKFQTCGKLIDAGLWPVAMYQCTMTSIKLLHNRNQYDIRKECEVRPMCYNLTSLENFMNTPVVQARLGVNLDWQFCSPLDFIFLFSDWISSTARKMSYILDTGLPVLVYNGDKDWLCNWIGADMWTSQVVWKGKQEYKNAPKQSWTLNGRAAGTVKSHSNLTFLVLHGAGHMVPMDKPREALEMMERFVWTQSILPNSHRTQRTTDETASSFVVRVE